MCAQQLNVSQINLTHGPDNKNVMEKTKNAKKTSMLKIADSDYSPCSQSIDRESVFGGKV